MFADAPPVLLTAAQLQQHYVGGREPARAGSSAAPGAEAEEKTGWFGSSKLRKEKREKRRRERAKKNPLSDVQLSLNAAKNTATDLLGDDVDGLEPADLAVNIDGFSTALNELEDSIAALEELIRKLEAKRRAQAKMCDPSQDVGMSKHVLNHCEEVEEPDRMFDRHEEKCAKRTADALAPF